MTRYWVNLGAEAGGIKEYYEKLEALANRYNTGQYEFVTEDLEESRNIAKKAIAITQRYLPHLEDDMIGVSIRTQPQCPKCGRYGSFSSGHCSGCGGVLTREKDIPIEERSDI